MIFKLPPVPVLQSAGCWEEFTDEEAACTLSQWTCHFNQTAWLINPNGNKGTRIQQRNILLCSTWSIYAPVPSVFLIRTTACGFIIRISCIWKYLCHHEGWKKAQIHTSSTTHGYAFNIFNATETFLTKQNHFKFRFSNMPGQTSISQWESGVSLTSDE